MIRVAILGAGNIGHALAALLGRRTDLEVVLWDRRLRRSGAVAITAHGSAGTYGIGAVTTVPTPARAVAHADVVVCAVPAHVRHRVLERIKRRLGGCVLLLAWEGMGRFAESVRALGIDERIAAGLQRSPMLARTRARYRSVEILGVRSRVLAAPVDPASSRRLQRVVDAVFPFRIEFVRDYRCVALSPGNPMIHPARVYACARQGRPRAGMRFYADWDDEASAVLLNLHRELARLREVLRLPVTWLRTLDDRARPLTAHQLTREILAEPSLRSILLPVRTTSRGAQLDRRHRFFREDIGEGLVHIARVARQHGLRLETTETICRWYRGRASASDR